MMSLSPCIDIPSPLRNGAVKLPDVDVPAFEYGVESKDKIRNEFFRPMYCPEGKYSSYGQLFYVPLSESFKFLLHLGEVGEVAADHEYLFAMDALVLYFIIMYGLMTWTYGIGAPTGLFVPSLAVGGAMGQIVGRTVSAVVKAMDSTIQVDLHTYAVVGAAASLGGATRMTISITVLVMETTGSMQLIIPLMLTIFFAKAIGDKYSHGIYDTHIKVQYSPL
jgi:chloride channel 7